MKFKWQLFFKGNLLKSKSNAINFFVLLYLFLLTLVIRLPSFFNHNVSADESTYILMGQSIVDGHLLYVDYWDLKPPLAFLFYAFTIMILGKSIISIRIAGALCVLLTSLLIYLIGKTLWNYRVGILGATMFIMMLGLLPGGQGTLTEHIAIVPLVGALYLLVSQKLTPRLLFFAGILMAVASLVRLNLAYVTLIVGFFVLFLKPLPSGIYILKRGLAYAGGSSLIIGLTYLPYVITGNQQVWWSSVVIAPLAYTNQRSTLGAFREHISYIGGILTNVQDSFFGISFLIWIGGLAGLVLMVVQWKNSSQAKQNGFILVAIFFFSTALSIAKGGAVYSHYLMQLVPFMALTTAVFLNLFLSNSIRWLTLSLFVLVLIIAVKPIVNTYKSLVSQIVVHGNDYTYQPFYKIAAYIDRENPLNEPIYMMSDHIVYWLIDAKPISKIVHPSNIVRDYFLKIIISSDTSSEREMAKILAKKPKFIVRTKYLWYLNTRSKTKILLEQTLRTQYVLVKEIEGRKIYRRI